MNKTILSIVIVLLIIMSVPRVLAPPLPPCVFYGHVSVGGKRAQDGLEVMAVIRGTTLNWTTTTSNGTYGWPFMGSSYLMIPSDNTDVSGKNGGATGDVIVFYVQGVKNSQTTYFDPGGSQKLDLSVPQISGGSGSTANSTITAALDVSTYEGGGVSVTGRLAYENGTGIEQANLSLAYMTFGGVVSWTNIASVTTMAAGYYTAQWTPGWAANATEDYVIKVSWEGSDAVQGCEANVALALAPAGETRVFSVVSNSIISNLAYNSTTRILNFTLTGPVGTAGYTNIALPETEIAGNITGLIVHLDQDVAYYTATNKTDHWLLYFTYAYASSTHNVTVNLPDQAAPPSQSPPFLETPLGIVTLFAVVLVAAALIYAARGKIRKPNEKPKKPSPRKSR